MTPTELFENSSYHIELYTVGYGLKRYIKILMTIEGYIPVFVGKGKTLQEAIDNLLLKE